MVLPEERHDVETGNVRNILSAKHQRRLIFRSLSILALVSVAILANKVGWSIEDATGHTGKSLLSSHEEEYPKALDEGKEWMLVFYVFGILYMFLGIAIVCDEFFVPTLTVLYSKEYLNLSDDVAGATLMAAGGSAPELATSFIGTFKDSPVGFGTIVGSAVFNILFVIGMCAVFSREVLDLTWWPLFRDCVYYTFCLVLLYLFFGPISSGIIEWEEALVLFLAYIGYCFLMKYHGSLHNALMKLKYGANWETELEIKAEEKLNLNFKTPSKFRTGIVALLTSDKSIVETAGIAAVVTLRGDMVEIFNELDKDRDGKVNKHELGELLLKVSGVRESAREKEEHVEQIFQAIKSIRIDREELGDKKHRKSPLPVARKGKKGKGVDPSELISLEEFSAWYLQSEKRIIDDMERTWNYFDRNGDGAISADEIREVFKFMNFTLRRGKSHVFTSQEIEDECNNLLRSMTSDGEARAVGKEEFMGWYRKSMFWQKAKKVQEAEVEEAEPIQIEWPEKGAPLRAWFFFFVTIPILVVLLILIPDVSKAGTKCGIPYRKFAPLAFFESLAVIAVFSNYMVDFATVIGDTLSIPPAVMGLTVLAAGTSVPDLLSSVIVARQGKGDMAVSSSVGSNIFDVTVGLPLPWLSYCIYHGRNVTVTARSLEFSVLVLILMLITVVVAIKLSDWKMSKNLGYAMFVLYIIFVGQDLIFNFVCDEKYNSYFDGCM